MSSEAEFRQAAPTAFDPTKPGTAVLFDEGPVGRPPVAGRGVRFTTADSPQKSREALGVWFRSNKAWKIYNNDANQTARTKIRNDLQTAIKANLPVDNPSVKDGLVSIAPDDTPFRATEGFAVVVTQFKSPWVFFTAQGSSEIAKFKQEINKISNRTTLNNIRSGLATAVQLKLSDPQGFINPTVTGDPIQFIDIHYSTGAVPENTKELLQIVEDRLKVVPRSAHEEDEGN
ncbi:unnamed protein product [Somion occarium]|uniref:Uncharacterized protein n=1 Tax=Somion occarium TaxID=3059160 RepID=A0ABP1CVZ8_9APHY